MDLTTLFALARQSGGLVTTDQARSIGVADQRLAELTRDGVVARIARGVYSLGDTGHGVDPRAIATSSRTVLSHESAVAWLGVDLPEPVGTVQITASRNRGRRHDAVNGAVVHRADLSRDDIVTVRGLRVTSPLRTGLDIARRSTVEAAVAIVDGLMRAGLLRDDEFVAQAARARGPGSVQVRIVASLICSKSGSVLESLTRVLLWRHGLPAPTAQFSLSHETLGWIGFMDFAWPDAYAILECDGYAFHSARSVFERDRRRWSAVTTAGWHIAVVTWFDVVNDPDYVAAMVQDLLTLESRGLSTQSVGGRAAKPT